MYIGNPRVERRKWMYIKVQIVVFTHISDTCTTDKLF